MILNEGLSEYVGAHTCIHKKKVMDALKANEKIKTKIFSSEPLFVGRFGATELSCIRAFDFGVQCKYDVVMHQMQMWSGVYPATNEVGRRFTDKMLQFIPELDLVGVWGLPFEDYYLKKYTKDQLDATFLYYLEPWSCPENPWSAALKGKKILVIHPFSETIQMQYKKREQLFPGTNILPEFELITLKAVQTVAGQQDPRFATWFDALDWMYQEAMKINFDVAVIGCGAYGFPLAAKLKMAGKKAIHLGGATQLMFGIRGKRWDQDEDKAYVRKFYNDAWVYPGDQDKPKNADQVEGGCYW